MSLLNSAKVYLFFLGLMGVLQGIYFTYFIGVLTTLEKRYAFDSQCTGIILIADNLSPALLSIVVGFYGKYTHKPRFLTCGMMVTVLSCFLCCLPFVIFGHGVDHLDLKHTANRTYMAEFCDGITNDTGSKCNVQELSESYAVVFILFMGNFLNGCGSTVYHTIGTSYLDDNIKKKNSPIYLGALFALRMIGPTFGFMLSSVCLRFYENPLLDPGFTEEDPRWIGCWWLGFLILGVALGLSSLPIALFPKHMVSHTHAKPVPKKKRIHEAFISLKELFKNRLLVFHAISIIFQINGIYAYQIFMPKYMEKQFGKTASLASFFSGATKLSTLIGGVLLGSFFIQKFQPTPKGLTGYMMCVSIFSTICLISAFFLGCSFPTMFGHTAGRYNPFDECNANCGCSTEKYEPICVDQRTMFHSFCFAGCLKQLPDNETEISYDCSCIKALTTGPVTVKKGYCDTECNLFLPYFIILTLSTVLTSTTRVGKVLVTLRCDVESNKSLTLGAVEFFVSIFATIPFPFIYGSVIDDSCLIWEYNCGQRGNCWQYDNDKFRYNIHALSAGFLTCCCFCEGFVFYLSKNLTAFYAHVTNTETNEEKGNDTEITLMTLESQNL